MPRKELDITLLQSIRKRWSAIAQAAGALPLAQGERATPFSVLDGQLMVLCTSEHVRQTVDDNASQLLAEVHRQAPARAQQRLRAIEPVVGERTETLLADLVLDLQDRIIDLQGQIET